MQKLLILAVLILAGCTTPAQRFAEQKQAIQLAQQDNVMLLASYTNSLKPLIASHQLTHSQAQQKIYDKAVELFGHSTDLDEFFTYAVYIASEEDKGHISHEQRMAMFSAKWAEIARKVHAERMEQMAAMSQAQQARAAQQQNAIAGGMMGLGLMQMGAPHPAASPIINCNSIQQGVFTNTSCQ